MLCAKHLAPSHPCVASWSARSLHAGLCPRMAHKTSAWPRLRKSRVSASALTVTACRAQSCSRGVTGLVARLPWVSMLFAHDLLHPRTCTCRAEPIRSDATRMRVRIVPDYEPPAMPRPYRDGEAHWPLWAAAQFDAHRWSDRVRRLCAQHFPDIRVPSLPPQRLSWWLVANLPVAARSCQELFRTRCVAKRLRKVLLTACARTAVTPQ